MAIAIKSFDIGQGDFFLIQASHSDGRYFNLMVDCGKPGKSGDLQAALKKQRLNGIVVTHVDDDHIVGVIDLLETNKDADFLNDVFIIYNRYDETLITYEKGNKLYQEIANRLSRAMLLKSYARNYNKENKKIESSRKKEELPVHILSKAQRMLMRAGAMERDNVYITLLSPTLDTLKKFMRDWKTVEESAKKTRENGRLKNQSSIAFLLEFDGKRILMTGDGLVSEIFEALRDIQEIQTIDYIKLSHHGAGDSNKGIEKFAEFYSCKNFGVTMKQNQNGEKSHPDRDIIRKLVDQKCHIYTSAGYQCDDPDDPVHKIEVKPKIDL